MVYLQHWRLLYGPPSTLRVFKRKRENGIFFYNYKTRGGSIVLAPRHTYYGLFFSFTHISPHAHMGTIIIHAICNPCSLPPWLVLLMFKCFLQGVKHRVSILRIWTQLHQQTSSKTTSLNPPPLFASKHILFLQKCALYWFSSIFLQNSSCLIHKLGKNKLALKPKQK